MQDEMLKASGVDWIVNTLDSSHSPFLSCPAELADCLMGLADKFGSQYEIRR